jgi:hypothetical protein
MHKGEGDYPWIEEYTRITERELLGHLVLGSPAVYMDSSIDTANCHRHIIARDNEVMPNGVSYCM